MPTLFKNFLLTAVVTLFCASAFAQKGVEDGSKYGHGEDSIRCMKNLSLFSEYIKQKDYADALPAWEIAFNECPLSSKIIYIDGVKIKEWQIKSESDNTKKDALIKDLMNVYDQRIKYFGNDRRFGEDYILGRKAISLFAHKKADKASRVKIEGWLKKSIENRQVNSEVNVLITYMQNTEKMYEAGQLGAEDMVKTYLQVSDLMDKQIARTTKDSTKKKLSSIKNSVEKLFAVSGAANCETIEKIFGPKLAENAKNVNWLKMVNKLLARAECDDAQLLYSVSEDLYAIEPSSSSAYGLARMYLKSKDLAKAIEFYGQAIKLEEDPIQKATYSYQLGLIMFNKGRLSEARTKAREAIQLRPNWGDPYILIGNLYAQSAKTLGKKEFEHKTAYWAAVDQFSKAKKVDPSTATKANELIKLYTKYFPGTEEIFFEGLKIGASYKVGGWIGVSTRVRSK